MTDLYAAGTADCHCPEQGRPMPEGGPKETIADDATGFKSSPPPTPPAGSRAGLRPGSDDQNHADRGSTSDGGPRGLTNVQHTSCACFDAASPLQPGAAASYKSASRTKGEDMARAADKTNGF